MPYSDDRFDKKLEKIISESDYKNYFDIGAGAGKFGKMINKIKNNVNLIGVEIDSSYVDSFGLKEIYKNILNVDIIEFINKNPSFTTDFVFIGDCIEHLKKSDGIDLLHYMIYRSKKIVIIYPQKYIQYDWKGHASESHRSVWGEHDFVQFNYEYLKDEFMHMVIIQGYLDDPEAIQYDT